MTTAAPEKAETTTVVLPEIPDMTLKDVCDGHASGAVSAYVRVEIPAETGIRYIDFCGHCYTAHEAALLGHGYRVRDERDRLRA